VRGFPV
jgi:hypothetical protein